MREPEGGFRGRVFIGRHDEREDIKTRLLRDGGFLLLYGQPLVGKASLALQVAEELQREQEDAPFCVYTVDCKDVVDWPGVMRTICRAFSFDNSAANENLLAGAISRRLQRNGGGKLLLLLLRVHRLTPTGADVQSMTRCLQTLTNADVMTLLTSRRQLQLPFQKRIKPLVLNDALDLLRHHAPDVTAAEFEGVLRHYCYGRPPLVMQVAHLVSGGPLLAFSAEELEEALARDPDLLMEGQSEEARLFFSTLSPDVQGQVSCLAQLLNGSFSVEAFTAVVGVEGARMKTVLRRMHEEAPVVLDNESQRMCIEPLVLHHIRKLGHVAADDSARLRVVTFLGRVLTRAERDLYVQGQDTVYGHLHGDWPQLQHVLRQAMHCTQDTYQAYMQVALKADKLLAKCFPNDALQFYQDMAAAAVHFGTARDQAVLQGFIGMTVTLGHGVGWEEAVQYFHRALPVLQRDPRSVCFLRLLVDLGIVYFRLNRLQEADRYLKQAVTLSTNMSLEDDQELIFHLLRARNFLALPCIFRGHLQESKDLLLETLELCEQLAPHHPDKPILINSLGLVYERSGWDQNRALLYYNQSLVERRKYAMVAPGDLVPTLNNVGMQYSRRGDYDTALQHLEEAAAIRKRDSRLHYYTALTEQHIGQVSIQRGDYARAERHLLESADVYSQCTPRHDVRAKVALCLAHLYITQPLRDIRQTRRYLREVCDLSENIGDNLSDTGLEVLMTAVQHRVQIDGWDRTSSLPFLLWAQQRICRFDGDPSQQLAEHQSIIGDMIGMLQRGFSEEQKVAVTSRVMRQCQMCTYLSINQDTHSLWRDMERIQEAQKAALTMLRDSHSLREVLDLSGQGQSDPAPPAAHERQGGQTGHRQQCVAQRLPELKPVETAPDHSRPSTTQFFPTGGIQEQRQDSTNEELQSVINRLLKPETGTEQQEAGDACREDRRHGVSQGQRDVTRPTDHSNADSGGSVELQAAVLPHLAAGDTGHHAAPPACPVTESGLHSSCSFTSSDLPSTISSETMSSGSRESAEDRHQQEVSTLRERIIEIVPQQETARDQNSAAQNVRETGSSSFGCQGGETGGDGGLYSAGRDGQRFPACPQPPHSAPLPSDPVQSHAPAVGGPFSSHPPSAQTPSPPLPRPASLVPDTGATTSPAARPSPTLERVVTCAQQLMAVLPSTATAEQRGMLEKLASLATSRPGPPSQHSTPLRGASQSRTSSAEQAGRPLQLQPHGSETEQRWCQSPNTTQEPDKTHTVLHSLYPFPSVTHSPDQSSFQKLHPSQGGTQPSVLTQNTEPDLNLTAAQDQLHAFMKLFQERCQTDAEQSQLSQEAATESLREGPKHTSTVQSDETLAGGVGAQQGVKMLHSPNQQRDAMGSLPHVDQTRHRDNSTPAACTRAFPEVQQEIPSPQTSAGETTEPTTGSSTVPPGAGPALTRAEGTDSRLRVSNVSTCELFGSRGHREPTESDDGMDPGAGPPAGQAPHPGQGSAPGSREATENDERLEDPQHVCTSVDCGCSLRLSS